MSRQKRVGGFYNFFLCLYSCWKITNESLVWSSPARGAALRLTSRQVQRTFGRTAGLPRRRSRHRCPHRVDGDGPGRAGSVVRRSCSEVVVWGWDLDLGKAWIQAFSDKIQAFMATRFWYGPCGGRVFMYEIGSVRGFWYSAWLAVALPRAPEAKARPATACTGTSLASWQ
jgi:hypothetical protein